jgi:hypothetical protein
MADIFEPTILPPPTGAQQVMLDLEEKSEPTVVEEEPKKKGGSKKKKKVAPTVGLLAALEQENINAWAKQLDAKPEEISRVLDTSLRNLTIPELIEGYKSRLEYVAKSKLNPDSHRELMIGCLYIEKLITRLKDLHKDIGMSFIEVSPNLTNVHGLRDAIETLGRGLEEADDVHGIVYALQNFRVDITGNSHLTHSNKPVYVDQDLQREYDRGYEEGYAKALASMGKIGTGLDIDLED